MSALYFLRYSLAILLLCSCLQPVYASDSIMKDVQMNDGQELHVRQYAANGDTLVLWVGASFGFGERHLQVSRQLADRGVEVWLVNIIESLFMPRGSNSMRKLSGEYVADLIEMTHRTTGKNIILMGRGYDAIAVLRGAHNWQRREQKQPYLLGGILFSPELYRGVPALGMDAEYVAVTYATNIPLMIFQGERRGNRWQLPSLIDALTQGGAEVYFQLQKDVNELFYHNDNHPATLARLRSLPDDLLKIFVLLKKATTPLFAQPIQKKLLPGKVGLDHELKPFVAGFQPHVIDLPGIDGTRVRRDDYRGKITVINFWATWCPPCVEEIPSLNRLKTKMQGLPFELISVNYAESSATVAKFMQQVKVDFPVLLDTSGQLSAQWKVIAFPSTYVIAPDGKIKYGVNAAIHWDDDAIVDALKNLLP